MSNLDWLEIYLHLVTEWQVAGNFEPWSGEEYKISANASIDNSLTLTRICHW